MIAYVVGGLAVASIAIALLFYYVRPARAIWRGDTCRMPIQLGPMITVTPRTYPSALLCVGTLTVAFALGGIAFALGGITGARWPEHLLIPAVIMLLANVVLVPLNWFVEATNRPKFLVPPPYRGQPGSFAAARETSPAKAGRATADRPSGRNLPSAAGARRRQRAVPRGNLCR